MKRFHSFAALFLSSILTGLGSVQLYSVLNQEKESNPSFPNFEIPTTPPASPNESDHKITNSERIMNEIYDTLNGHQFSVTYWDLLSSFAFFEHDPKLPAFLDDTIFTILEQHNISGFSRSNYFNLINNYTPIALDSGDITKTPSGNQVGNYDLKFTIVDTFGDARRIINMKLSIESTFSARKTLLKYLQPKMGIHEGIEFAFKPDADLPLIGVTNFINSIKARLLSEIRNKVKAEMQQDNWTEESWVAVDKEITNNLSLEYNYQMGDNDDLTKLLQKEEDALFNTYLQNISIFNQFGSQSIVGLYFHNNSLKPHSVLDLNPQSETNGVLDSYLGILRFQIFAPQWSQEKIIRITPFVDYDLNWFSYTFSFTFYNRTLYYYTLFFVILWLIIKWVGNHFMSWISGTALATSAEWWLFKFAVSMGEFFTNPLTSLRAAAFIGKYIEVFTFNGFGTLLSTPVLGPILYAAFFWIIGILTTFLSWLAFAIFKAWDYLEERENETISYTGQHFGLVTYWVSSIYVGGKKIW